MSCVNKVDLEALSEINGYTFDTTVLFEELDNVVIAYGIRNRDKKTVVAKSSHQPLRLEKEYHIVQRLFGEDSAKKMLCQPLEKLPISEGFIMFIYEAYGQNLLDDYQTQRMPLCTLLEFAIQCCDCLEMIHKHQIVHGEIKLSSFLWLKDQPVKIHNFGLGARGLDISLASGGWKKTIHRNDRDSLQQMLIHISPEQTGRTSFQPDHRTDLYSLGISLFILLTQTLPFIHSSPMETVHNVLNKKLPLAHELVSNIPPIISAIIEKLTSKSPDERYTSAHGLRHDFKRCLDQLEKRQKLSSFDLGTHDIASIFTLPNKPSFGHTTELSLVNSIVRRAAYMYTTQPKQRPCYRATMLPDVEGPTFKRVHNKKGKRAGQPTEVVAMHGQAGVGKSTLVRNARTFAQEYGYTALSKFDKKQPTPYGCILRCLSTLLRNILEEDPAEIHRFLGLLKHQLGTDHLSQLPTLLVDNVPELFSFMQRHHSPLLDHTEVGEEIKTRFHTALIEIFQAVFLEDLHEADQASLELLSSLISAKLDLLIVFTYRENEMSERHSSLLSNHDAVVSFVNIKNLNSMALMELVQATMHRQEEIDSTLLVPLVDFIHKKTDGNPFYVCQLLATLKRKDLIFFTWEKRRWEYNIQEIEKGLETSDGLSIEFLVRQMMELPPDGRKFLKWASFIGNSFHYETVKHLMLNDDILDREDLEQEPLDAINGLQSALQQGFIRPTRNDRFRFGHDCYVQVANMLAPLEHRELYHLRIATYFMNKPHVDTFWLADHLREALGLLKTHSPKAPYRSKLIQAGDKAFDSGAHQLAFAYYSTALELLSSSDPWVDGQDTKYTETLHLYARLAEVSWLTDGDQKYLETVLKRARSPIDCIVAYRIQHRYRWSRTGGNMKSVMMLVHCLKDLGGEAIHTDLSQAELEKLYRSTKHELLKLGIQKMETLPVCEDRLARARFSIMEEICLCAYWTNNTSIMLAVGSQFVFMTLKFGITPATGVGLVFFGIIAMHLFEEYNFAEQMGQVGINLCGQFEGLAETGRAQYLYATFLSIWKYPYKHSVTMARTATKKALLGGDCVYSAFAQIQTILVNLLCGDNFADLLKEAKNYLEESTGASTPLGTFTMAVTITRAILALQGKTYLSEKTIFDDREFNEADFVSQTTDTNPNPQFHYYYFAMKAIVLSAYEFNEAAVGIMWEQMPTINAIPVGRLTQIALFMHCISLSRWIEKSKRTDLLKDLLRTRDKFAEWAKNSHPDNLQPHLDCIDAEIASFNGNNTEAQKLFDSAIRRAKSAQWIFGINIIYKLAGEYYLKLGLHTVAAALIEKSITGFRHSGAGGLALHIEKKHREFLQEFEPLDTPKMTAVQTDTPQTKLTKKESVGDLSFDEVDMLCNLSVNSMKTSPEEALSTLDIVDLASILKSCQLISSEMDIQLLLKQMLGIVLENSGADSGVIIVKEDTSFFIHGRGSQQNEYDIYNEPKLLSEEEESVMTRISQYAIQTQKSLFVVDVQQDPRFSDETMISKSCICTPIIHKSTVVGCIYIEAPIGSLTSRHEVVLRLLSQQIGISITNALLFQRVQKVTHANLKMIESQKAALEEARKSKEAALHAMKLKADFLANMSHELRTPFSGFYGMISLLSETSLDSEQQDIVLTAKESCETLLKIIDDLLNFSKLEAGKVNLDLGPLVVEEVVADTIEILCSLAARKGIELAYIVDPNVPTTVIADSSRVRQILTNLVGNAIKFTHEGGVVIKCHLDTSFHNHQPLEENQDDCLRLKFEVIDTGIGICSNEKQRLFEPFSQLDGSTTRKYGGTGLGLSICLQLVRLMMGDIGVESQTGSGSNFWFTVVVNKEKSLACNSRRGPSAALKQLQKNQCLLVATSSDLNAKMIGSLLSDFRLAYTSDMHQAVSRAVQGHHPILILDLPPNPSGFINHQIQSVVDDPECKLHIVLLYTPSTEGHKIAAEATNSGSNRRGRLVKMAKPVRRNKLLKLLYMVVSKKKEGATLPSLNPVTSTRMKDYFHEEELASYSKKSVLIAEDNFVARKLLKQQLEKLGFTVETACNGEEAIELYRQKPPDYFSLAFFDHHMPKCDGVEATKKIRSLEENTSSRLPIVALTADIQSSAKKICVDAGMDDYLTKPLIPKNLANTLRQLYSPIHQEYYDATTPSTLSSSSSSSFL
ncbi:hypothetical protein BY458DRAFT_447847 [Sporodiniella umbellata]|nr:hypothetical protein BY458DRAFT_447847 [Sporodiniella umbellata]